ncbi:Fanconi anemia group C protein-like isoform X2 [Ptychodera flava]|uniref:Fanconi anemia group C protein-like isoform X2 n=1 Tax=Ptychodera flava TaxID=63121 RepID=UPI00396A1520
MSETATATPQTDDQLCAKVDDWLTRVKVWGQADDGPSAREAFECKTSLNEFLVHLYQVLSQWDTHFAVKTLPNVGQLLGRLCCNSVVLLSESTYKILLKCILTLAPEEPKDDLEEKAKRWAHSQIKNTAAYVPAEKPFKSVTEMTGFLPHEFNQIATQKLIDAIQTDLDTLCCRRWSSKTNCLIPVRSSVASTHINSSDRMPGVSGDVSLRDISDMCLPLLHLQQALPLVESLLRCHSGSITEELSTVFLEKVTELQGNAYMKESCDLDLSYEGRLQLWSRYFPALEQEVRSLIRVILVHRPFCSRREALSIIQSRNLPQACTDNPSIYRAVTAMLKSILVSCHGNTSVLKLISLFSVSILDAASHGCEEPQIEICSLYSLGLRPLVQLLQIKPKGLSNSACYVQIKSICAIINELKLTEDTFAIWWILVQFEWWFYKAIELVLIPDIDLDMTLTLLCWYAIPLSNATHHFYKTILKDVICPLQVLQSKVYLKSCDIQYTLSANKDLYSNQLIQIVTPLLVLFLLKSSGGHLIAVDILEMAIPTDSAISALSNFLDTLEGFVDLSGSITFQQLGSAKSTAVRGLLSTLRERCIDNPTRPSSSQDEDLTRVDQLVDRCDEFIASFPK